MKKYLLTPIPLALGILNSILYHAAGPDDQNILRSTQEDVDYLSTTSVTVGTIISIAFLLILIIHDITGWFDRRSKQRELERFTHIKKDDSK